MKFSIRLLVRRFAGFETVVLLRGLCWGFSLCLAVNAVAVAFDAAVNHMVVQAGDAGHGHGTLDPLINRGNPPTVGPAAGAAVC